MLISWVLSIGLLLGLGFYFRSEFEKKILSEEATIICSPKIKEQKRFVFLTDLHNVTFGAENHRLLRIIDQVHPDFILLGGDFIVSTPRGEVKKDVALHLIQNLSANYPVYWADGNHESRLLWKPELYGEHAYDTFLTELRSFGVICLSNESVEIGDGIRITGIDLPESAYKKIISRKKRDVLPEDMESPLLQKKEDCFEILLAHSPLYFDEYRKWGADLTLAGHFHGGTIRLPLFGGMMTPQFQFFYPYTEGTFEKDKKWMIVSRGLGTHSINIRWNNLPEVVVVQLAPEVS
jgi:predicted MPP superfamily phosphohydrolase